MSPDDQVWFNGRFLPLGEVAISPLDRGFLFGDGAYEVIPVYARRPFRLTEHLARLARTLAGIRLANPHTASEWAEIIAGVIARQPWAEQSVYLHITRGVADRRDHAFPSPPPVPTRLVWATALTSPPLEQRIQGVRCLSAADDRWARCDLKTISLLANCLLRQRAVDTGCAETILFRDGFLTEGAAANVFVVRGGTLLAPPKNHHLLPGITYDVVLELAHAHGLPTEVRDVREEEVRTADELWISSSTKEVLPVTELDGRPVGSGRPGPVYAGMYRWYQAFKAGLSLPEA